MRTYVSRTKKKFNAEHIVRWRASKQFTQKRAARHIGVSLPTYQNAEYGRELQLVKASKISMKTGVPFLEELEERSA